MICSFFTKHQGNDDCHFAVELADFREQMHEIIGSPEAPVREQVHCPLAASRGKSRLQRDHFSHWNREAPRYRNALLLLGKQFVGREAE